MSVGKDNKRSAHYPWTRLSKENLLATRVCDLGLSLGTSPLVPRINRLQSELHNKGIRFRPHFWLSDEWFCPDDIPGIAIPFFLAHPRLKKLERDFILEVEGGDINWCMKLLRHETAHALANAYQLSQRKDWRRLFGNPHAAYRDTYLPQPYSKRFVLNLPGWYAQSHPHEDWAETFAVWLNPGSLWRRRYRHWAALKKLHYVDELMQEIKQKPAKLRNKRTEHPIEKIRITLSEYYNTKIQRYGIETPEFFDIDLRRLFVDGNMAPDNEKASRYIRRIKKSIIDIVARWTNEYKYRINTALQEMITRCEELDLRLPDDTHNFLPELTSCLTMQVMNKLHSGGFHLSR